MSHEYLRADDFARSVDESLTALQVDYVDLLLVHWPNPEIPLAETMPALAKAKRQGLARHIGVANFNIALLDQAIGLCPEPLVSLQAEYHPYLDQSKLLDACASAGSRSSPIARSAAAGCSSDPVLAEIAERKGKTHRADRAALADAAGTSSPIPRSSNPERIAENFEVFDFHRLSDEMRAASPRSSGPTAGSPIPAGRAPVWD